jgi:hypothetical protein
MTTNWNQENCDSSSQAKVNAENTVRDHHDSFVPFPILEIDYSLTDRVESAPLPTAGNALSRIWLVGWGVMLLALAGMVIAFSRDLVSFGTLGYAVTVAGIVASAGLGHYIFWRRRAKK